MLDVAALSFDYQEKPVLQGIEFTLQQGQLLHLHGSNGVGKTTLLKLLAGLMWPLSGKIYYQGKSIDTNLSAYQQNICFVGHRTGISDVLTVKENCLFDLHWGRKNIDLSALLSVFGLSHVENELCYRLSSGQRRRLGLLRTVMTDAKLWLLDEPLTALDTDAINVFSNLLEAHLNQGGLAVVASHQALPMRTMSPIEYAL